MDDLNASFSRLGPLVKTFPRSQTVRFHLGLLLAWTGQRAAGGQRVPARARLGPADEARATGSAAFLKGVVTDWD